MHTTHDQDRGRFLGKATCLEPHCQTVFRRYENDSVDDFEARLTAHKLAHRARSEERPGE
jgi:hypothetical protein